MKQAQREQILENFAENKENDEKNGVESSILLTTDVAARGLDIPGVDWIVQFDMPQDPSRLLTELEEPLEWAQKGSALGVIDERGKLIQAFIYAEMVIADSRMAITAMAKKKKEEDLDAVVEEDANGAERSVRHASSAL
ncbi:unnamed protein product [Bathycoccus prasinos]